MDLTHSWMGMDQKFRELYGLDWFGVGGIL